MRYRVRIIPERAEKPGNGSGEPRSSREEAGKLGKGLKKRGEPGEVREGSGEPRRSRES